MIRYSRHFEPNASQQRAPIKTQSLRPQAIDLSQVQVQVPEPDAMSIGTDTSQQPVERLMPGAEQLELTAPETPPQKDKRSKPATRKAKVKPTDSGAKSALPLLTGLEGQAPNPITETISPLTVLSILV